MAEPGAELARDVVACPGADTCNLAVTQSRGLADAIGAALEEAGLADVGGVRTNISGCTNCCGQHHIADIGFYGAERRAHGQSGPGLPDAARRLRRPGARSSSARRPCACRPRHAPEATVRVVGRFADERQAGEAFRGWLERVGRRQGASPPTSRTSTSSPRPTSAPDFYVDFGETGPYVAEIGESECAAHDRHGRPPTEAPT